MTSLKVVMVRANRCVVASVILVLAFASGCSSRFRMMNRSPRLREAWRPKTRIRN